MEADPVAAHRPERCEQLREDTDRDLILSAEQAVAYGVADARARQPEAGHRGRLYARARDTPTDRIIASLSAHHDSARALAAGLTDEQLKARAGRRSGPSPRCLSHLGQRRRDQPPASSAASAGEPAPRGRQPGHLGPLGRARPAGAGRRVRRARRGVIVELVEALTAEQRDTLRVDLGFLPEPVPLVDARRDASQRGRPPRLGRPGRVDPAATVGAEGGRAAARAARRRAGLPAGLHRQARRRSSRPRS